MLTFCGATFLCSKHFTSKFDLFIMQSMHFLMAKYIPLQGDVGCGKTVVAFLACMEVIGSGFQVG